MNESMERIKERIEKLLCPIQLSAGNLQIDLRFLLNYVWADLDRLEKENEFLQTLIADLKIDCTGYQRGLKQGREEGRQEGVHELLTKVFEKATEPASQ